MAYLLEFVLEIDKGQHQRGETEPIRTAKWEEVENGFPAIVIRIYLRREGRIDASVGAGMTRDDCISAIHHAFAGDGKVAQSVDVVT